MTSCPTERITPFIDGANLYASAKALNTVDLCVLPPKIGRTRGGAVS